MSSYAQFGEDLILAQLFDRLGTTNAWAVDIGASDGAYESNTAYFRHRGWTVLLFDRKPRAPRVRRAHVTSGTINSLLAAHHVPQTFDLLSIDVDGNDYWLWQALTYQPRLVIIEYNPRFLPAESVTVPDDPWRCWDSTDYFGASVTALWRLGQQKGYDLVASSPVNLIFAQAGQLPALQPFEVIRLPPRKAPDPYHRPWVAV